MKYAEFIDRVEHEGGFRERADAERAAAATVAVLGERLPAIDRDAVADGLPAALGALVRAGERTGEFDLDELYARVSRREGVPLGTAVEHAQVVCRVLGVAAEGEARKHLVLHLPRPLAQLFESPERPVADPHPHEATAGRHRTATLSEGRPGSHHPVSEARPHGQRGSLSETDNPHGESKLSTGATSQERAGETIGTGRPGSTHPLSESSE
jgi:uncharacterized protein (DUF2267 family)